MGFRISRVRYIWLFLCATGSTYMPGSTVLKCYYRKFDVGYLRLRNIEIKCKLFETGDDNDENTGDSNHENMLSLKFTINL